MIRDIDRFKGERYSVPELRTWAGDLTCSGIVRTTGFALLSTLVIVLAWTTAAQAQTPTQDQYDERNAPFGSALSPSGASVGQAKTGSANASSAKTGSSNASSAKMGSANASGTKAGKAKAGEAKTGGGSKSSSKGSKADRLPATGGPALLGYMVMLAALSTGLVYLGRRFGRDG